MIVLSYTEENNQMNYIIALNKKWLDILDFFDLTPILILNDFINHKLNNYTDKKEAIILLITI